MSSKGWCAGVARVDITPPIGIQLFGYHRAAPMATIRDPLWITALVFVHGDGVSAPLVVLAVDHVGMGRAEATALRRAASVAIGASQERVAVCFSHTHSGPDTEVLDWSGHPRPHDALERVYGATLPAQAATATRLALERVAPARVGCAQTTSIVGINRRPRNAQGRVVSTGPNPNGTVDTQVAVLRVADINDRTVACVVHCGVHGGVFRGDNLACSADVTGAARAIVEAATGAPCLVVQGAAGDVNPRWRGDEVALQRAGWELGGAALRALALAEMAPLNMVNAAEQVISLRLLPLPDEQVAVPWAAEVAQIWESPTAAWVEAVRGKLAAGERQLYLPLELQAIRINDFVRVGLPLEPFAGLSLALRERLSSHTARGNLCVAFGGYTNGCIGYLATAEEHAAGGYEIEWMPVVYGYYEGMFMPPVPDAADEVVDAATHLVDWLCHDHTADQNGKDHATPS